jgi:signal transduction histidine kinase
MTGSDLPILLALVAITAYFLWKRRRVLLRVPGYGLIGGGLVMLTLTMVVDWLFLGIDHVVPAELDPVLSTTLIAYLGFVPGILAIGVGLTLLLPGIDRINAEIEARRAAELAAEQRARDLQAAKLEAEAANAAKSRFLASMNHELRTPLNAIIGFAELLQQQPFGPLGDGRYGSYAGDIEHSGRHLLAIINDILDMSKIEAGAERLHESDCELGLIVDGAVRMVQAEYNRRGIVLEVDRHLADCLLRADSLKLGRVLINLLSNAMKFTDRGGTVRLGTRLDPTGALQVTLTDTGIGMSAAQIEVALMPFGQADPADGRARQGTGLGLPISKAVMELHGGSLEIASAPGQGTTVTLTLPAARVIEAAVAPQAAGD